MSDNNNECIASLMIRLDMAEQTIKNQHKRIDELEKLIKDYHQNNREHISSLEIDTKKYRKKISSCEKELADLVSHMNMFIVMTNHNFEVIQSVLNSTLSKEAKLKAFADLHRQG